MTSPDPTEGAAAQAAASHREERIGLGPDRSGKDHSVRIVRFGAPGARPKAYIQAGLHADELPGQLVARRLVEALAAAAARGEVIGEVAVVPAANPIGLKQVEGGYMQGRVERGSGRNFNRGFPALAELIGPGIADKLTDDPAQNVAAIRKAMGKALRKLRPVDAFETLQHTLIGAAYDADIMLDLHADNEALLHLYTGETLWPEAEDLAAELDARAVLLCDDSGGGPFDEACGGPWWTLAAAHPDRPIPPACLVATVELRSNNAVDGALADRDARAILRFLQRRGVVAGNPGGLPRLLCKATSLRAMQQLKSPIEGVVDYRLKLGDRVRKGDLVAEVIPPEGAAAEIVSATDGLLFARHDQTYAWPGKFVGKIAGEEILPERTGELLTA